MNSFLRDRSLSWERDVEFSDAELLAEAAGRICYMSFGDLQYRKSTTDYLANIIRNGHESVLEHASFTFLIDGVSRALTHQLVRHRAGFAYSQLSQQYHDESGCEFIEPEWGDDEAHLEEQWKEWAESTRSLYKAMLSSTRKLNNTELSLKEKTRGARSAARSVLPNATKTTLVITGNARAWRNMLSVRGCIPGDIEMRNYCLQIFKILRKEAPSLFSDFELLNDELGAMVKKI
ncbi:FAD-dependent thymidylate synthase [Stutzerimonas nitrititolerans]|uniref:FAD-dependent thymidylate synthase n=1 Tax=Stutzerimonas nitrititolerans TaxID=2482751 RepID=UPI0028AE4691|nr:FAD-dependent thymidylate synthase [Stutzerimonas nitrititolerans]